jgi:glyoxylate/hydroxypyruvate reductase A
MTAPPSVVVHLEGDDPAPWCRAIEARCPGWRAFASDAVPVGAEATVRAAVVWLPPPGLLGRFPNLADVVSTAAGLDHLARDPSRPAAARVHRRQDPASTRVMAEFVLAQVLIHHRELPRHWAGRAARVWDQRAVGPLSGRAAGVIGFGPMGRATAETLAGHGVAVTAWSRTPRDHPAVAVVTGEAGLDRLLAGAEFLVMLLPSSADTGGFLSAGRIARLPAGAVVINCGRGDTVDLDALLAALDAGHLSGASLDVLPMEPPPPAHPVWDHPRVLLTPHVASLPRPAEMAAWLSTLLAGGTGPGMPDPSPGPDRPSPIKA